MVEDSQEGADVGGAVVGRASQEAVREVNLGRPQGAAQRPGRAAVPSRITVGKQRQREVGASGEILKTELPVFADGSM